MTVTETIGVLKRRFHQRAVVMDTVIDGQSRHHPLATGMSVGRGRVRVIQHKASADGVGDSLEHVGTTDGRASYGKLALTVRGHDVKIAVTVNILQRIIGTVDAVAQRHTWIDRYFYRYNFRRDIYSKCNVAALGCGCRFVKSLRTLPYKRSIKSYASIQCNHDIVTRFPYLIGQSV